MRESEADADLNALRRIRRQLTVAFLAVEQLCRKVSAFPPAQRLCSFAINALTQIKDEMVGIEERILRRERRRGHLPDKFPNHPPDV